MEEYIELKLRTGSLVIQIFQSEAPITVNVFKKLCISGFYIGLSWYRVVPNFVAQTGCPFGTGKGSLNLKIPYEKNKLSHIRGSLSMIKDLKTGYSSCQFLICYKQIPKFDNLYTVFGQVLEGMENLEKIKVGLKENNYFVENPDRILNLNYEFYS